MMKSSLARLLKPSPEANIDEHNFRLVMLDAIGLGIASSAAPFINVFLVGLGASNSVIGFLASMPALAGFLLVLFIGRFLQKRGDVIKWASISVWATYSGYLFTGLLPFVLPRESLVIGILLVWAVITIPQTIMGVTYQAMLKGVAGENGRFELTTRRWALLGMITAFLTTIAGQVIDLLNYPFNYQIVFMVLSLGGLISFTAVRRIRISSPTSDSRPNRQTEIPFKQYPAIIKSNKPFSGFIAKRFVYLLGATLIGPIVSLYYIKEIQATAGWIGIFSTTSTITLIVGYFFWLRMSRKVNTRRILLLTVFMVSIWPIFLSFTKNPFLIVFFLVFVGFFQAGIDLVFFDELMKTIPAGQATLFISINMLFQYFANFIGPLLGTTLADFITLRFVLIVGSSICLTAFILFFFGSQRKKNAIPADN